MGSVMKVKTLKTLSLLDAAVAVVTVVAFAIAYALSAFFYPQHAASPSQPREAASSKPAPAPSPPPPTKASQDELRTLVQAVRNALQCPVPPAERSIERPHGAYTYVYRIAHEFTGGVSELSFQSQGADISFRKGGGFGQRTEYEMRQSAPVRELEMSRPRVYDSDHGVTVQLECQNKNYCVDSFIQHTCVVTAGSGDVFQPCKSRQPESPRTAKYADINIPVCDKKTAAGLIDALSALQAKAR
jgi:hypothetical protein